MYIYIYIYICALVIARELFSTSGNDHSRAARGGSPAFISENNSPYS